MKRNGLHGVGPLSRMVHRASSSKSENVILADALNLLSPSKNSNNPSNYKPSLFKSLTRGPVSEQEIKIKEGKFSLPEKYNSAVYVDNLLSGIKSSILNTMDLRILEMKGKKLTNYLRELADEEKLEQITEFLYYHDQLTFSLFANILLNKHLKDLSKLPFDIHNTHQASHLKWSEISHIHKDILLMRKFSSLKKPLMVIKNLKNNFDKHYFPMIKQGKLSPFYERVVWKFYFDNIKQYSEMHYMDELNNVKSSVLIWESSLENNHDIANYIMKIHEKDLNVLQMCLFKVCASKAFQSHILQELEQSHHSRLLSKLKRLSIKYKSYALEVSTDNETEKLTLYSFISSLGSVINDEMTKHDLTDPSLQDAINDLKVSRETILMKAGILRNISEWDEASIDISKQYN